MSGSLQVNGILLLQPRPNFSQPSSRIALVYQSFGFRTNSRSTLIRLDRRIKFGRDMLVVVFVLPVVFLLLTNSIPGAI